MTAVTKSSDQMCVCVSVCPAARFAHILLMPQGLQCVCVYVCVCIFKLKITAQPDLSL